jgi:hypothetical protein
VWRCIHQEPNVDILPTTLFWPPELRAVLLLWIFWVVEREACIFCFEKKKRCCWARWRRDQHIFCVTNYSLTLCVGWGRATRLTTNLRNLWMSSSLFSKLDLFGSFVHLCFVLFCFVLFYFLCNLFYVLSVH